MSQRTAKWEDLTVGTKLYSPGMFTHSATVVSFPAGFDDDPIVVVRLAWGGTPFTIGKEHYGRCGRWCLDPAEIEAESASEEVKP